MEGTTKKTKGKQKREMKKIENPRDLYISFTKRKDGLSNKSTEVKALAEADMKYLLYSPSGNPYTYGDPSIESMTMTPSEREQSDDIYKQLANERKRLSFQQETEKHNAFVDEVNTLKEKQKHLDKFVKNNNDGRWEGGSNEALHDGNVGKYKEMEASLFNVHNTLRNELSLHGAYDALDDQTNAGVDPYPFYASGSSKPGVAYGGNLSSGFGSNALNLAPSDAHYQGDGAFMYNASNVNEAGGSGSGSGSGGDTYYNASDENGGLPFPPFNGHGHGHGY